MTAMQPASALAGKTIEELRREVRALNLLKEQQSQGEKPSATTANKQSPSLVASMESTKGAQNATISPVASIEPLPVIDTSRVSYPSFRVTPPEDPMMGRVITASVPLAHNSSVSGSGIEASPWGWQIAGIAWYVWLLLIAALGVVAQSYRNKKRSLPLAEAK